MNATVTNSKPPRKQLSDQLDRLDLILDALSEGLNGAVADAAREGTRLALKDAIVEIVTDPILRARLREAAAPESSAASTPSPKTPGFWARMKAKASQAAAAVSRAASRLVDDAAHGIQMVGDFAAGAFLALKDLGRFRTLAIIGLGGGMAAKVASYLAPDAMRTAAVRIRVWSQRTFRTLMTA
ncbi:MAG TPA: hypothetical protein VGG61_05880 [Gemmataceae bacterium]